MARVVQHVAARVVIHLRQKALEGHAVVQVFTGVNFVAQIDAMLVKAVQEWPPAASQFVKRLIQQQRVMRRPRVEVRPRQRPGEGGMRLQTQTRRRPRRIFYVLNRPLLTRRRVTA